MLAKLLTNVVLISGVALGGVLYLDHKNSASEAAQKDAQMLAAEKRQTTVKVCLLYTSPSPRDRG